ncbi:XRE family transcriptional regulator [Arcobacter sp.]|uniref:XRE family transcriptional regulator n=1 Tax=unclassified Arcobacter TaxID=2593671 RepID=UPI003AFFF472
MNNLEFEEKLLLAGISKEKFAKLTNIPISTIRNWTTKRNGKESNCAKWVESYLDLFIQNKENKIYINKLIKELKNEK